MTSIPAQRWVSAAARLLGGLALVTAAVGVALPAAGRAEQAGGASLEPPGKQSVEPPNVLVIESDDQTDDSMRYMPRTEAMIGDQGVSFPQSFVNYPLCCPSRATMLTGQYAHNHGVMNNFGPIGGFDRLDSTNTLPIWLQRSGYYTGLIGKYLNGYERHRDEVPPLVPPGYSEWQGSTVTYTYFGYELNENGSLVRYGNSEGEYSTDLYTAKAIDFVNRRAPQEQPFFLWLSYLAPHSGGPNPNPHPPQNCGETAKPAPRHARALDGEPLPQPPSFNEGDLSDKPPGIADNPPLSGADLADEVRYYRCRAKSLLAIDEGVGELLAALRASGELDRTLVIYTSDNGFMHGEHRQKTGKVVLYEESIRVPLRIRGPGFRGGRSVAEMVTNADLAATILEAAGVEAGRRLDGRALQPFAAEPGRERGRELLIEALTYRALRTRRYVYAAHVAGPSAGARELYDLSRDPFQLQSLHADPAYDDVEAALARRLAQLADCAGPACRRLPQLRLELFARNARGRPCKAAPVRVGPSGADLGQVRQAELYVNGERVGIDRRRGFRRKVPYARLRRRATSTVGMRLTLLDGRRLTRELRLRACRA